MKAFSAFFWRIFCSLIKLDLFFFDQIYFSSLSLHTQDPHSSAALQPPAPPSAFVYGPPLLIAHLDRVQPSAVLPVGASRRRSGLFSWVGGRRRLGRISSAVGAAELASRPRLCSPTWKFPLKRPLCSNRGGRCLRICTAEPRKGGFDRVLISSFVVFSHSWTFYAMRKFWGRTTR